MILANNNLLDNPLIILVIVIGIAAGIAIVAFLIHKLMVFKIKDNDKPSEEEIAREEMERLLKPVEDEEVAQQIDEYNDDEGEDEE